MAMDSLIESWNRILILNDIMDNISDKQETVVPTTESAARLCWHCCHPWEGENIMYPFSYDSRTCKFKTGGQFCTWGCIKGHLRDSMSRVVTGIHQVNSRHYRKMVTGLTDMIIPAPPKVTLKAFGGHLTIEEFRAPQKNIEYNMNYDLQIKIIPYDMCEYKSAEKNVITVDTEAPLAIKSTGITNEHLRLRRAKPLAQGRTNIERSLGLNTFANFIKSS